MSPPPVPRVLVVGYRGGLTTALRALGVEYAIWHHRPLPQRSRVPLHIEPFDDGPAVARRAADALGAHGAFTHVIAGTEAAVVPASRLRRLLGARPSQHRVVLCCHDKLLMKRVLRACDVPMSDFVDGNAHRDPDALVRRLGSPVVLKPRRDSGGRGIVLATDAAAVARCGTHNRLAERHIDAPEFSIESFVQNGRILFSNVTEYFRKKHVNIVPGNLAPAVHHHALELNRKVISALGIEWGVTHVELYQAAQGLLFGEIALRPPGGYIMELLQLAYGFDAWRALVEIELGRDVRLPQAARAHAGAVILHPGAGRVTALHGLIAARAHAAVVKLHMRIAAGAEVSPRLGVGSNVGYALLRTGSRPELLGAIDTIERTIEIELAGG